MADLTPERIANFRETMRLHGANKVTVQLPFDTFAQFLDAAEQAVTLRAENERLRKVGAVLANIADAYDDNALDNEARKFWGMNDEHENQDPPSTIELYTGRGGRRLLTLQDCFNARAAIREGGAT